MSEPEATLTAIQIAVQELAKLTPIEFDQVLEAKAKELKCRPRTLEAEVKKEWARQKPQEDLIRFVTALCPEETREILLNKLAEQSPEERAKLKANIRKTWGH
jgi:hypothetical protein